MFLYGGFPFLMPFSSPSLKGNTFILSIWQASSMAVRAVQVAISEILNPNIKLKKKKNWRNTFQTQKNTSWKLERDEWGAPREKVERRVRQLPGWLLSGHLPQLSLSGDLTGSHFTAGDQDHSTIVHIVDLFIFQSCIPWTSQWIMQSPDFLSQKWKNVPHKTLGLVHCMCITLNSNEKMLTTSFSIFWSWPVLSIPVTWVSTRQAGLT